MRIMGLDPGLRHTGWGVITHEGTRLKPIAAGVISISPKLDFAERLKKLFDELVMLIDAHSPDEVAVEETFVNVNPASTLKLGMARGVVMLAPAHAGLQVHEYTANQVKKAIVGKGHADKNQMTFMIKRLLPGIDLARHDAADALAIAVCHAHMAGSMVKWQERA